MPTSARFFQLPCLFLFLALTACATKSTIDAERAIIETMYSTKIETHSQETTYFEIDDGDLDYSPELAAPPASYPQLHLIKPTSGTTLGSPFGMRRHPTKRTPLLHAGIDIAGQFGERVVASAPGTVLFSGNKGAYGLTIEINAGKGILLRYAHLDKVVVNEGEHVKQGQHIGNLGRTGRVTAEHLHFEVRLKNKPIDPMRFIEPEHRWAVNTGSAKSRIALHKKF